MKTIRQACVPRDSTFDATRRDTVLDLTDLIDDRIDPVEFFAENHITEGMKTLLTEGFRRLEGKSTQGVFKLTQAMGGGKTHNLLALGLLAKHPVYRAQVMGEFYTPGDLGDVHVVAFSGRESDAAYGVWGAIADQLGKKEQFNDYYSPLSAPGQTAWVNLLKGPPLVIMLDELPPYFVNAASKSIGNSDLSVVTGTALSNLLVAIGRDELRNVCLVISDLTASYSAGSDQIVTALEDLERETGRTAMNLEPVRMNTDEFYHILRKRIFETLPDETDVEEVAQGYAKAIRDARQMDVTNASPEQFAGRVAESYPFHPGIRDLYARFRENRGFQQTRGLIRLMRIVVSRIWDSERDPFLIATHDVDLGDRETMTEINQVNPTLESAIAHDISSGGSAVAERMDANLGGIEDTQDVMRLLLVASLASVPGAAKGLTMPEIVEYLCAPGRDISRLRNEVIAHLVTAAWYLHTTGDGRLHVRNVQNLVARVTTTASQYHRDQATKELKERLKEIFKPGTGWCYQCLLPLPAVDDIDVGGDKVTLVISEPHPKGLHPDLEQLYDQHTYRNRLCFLTGQRPFDSLLQRARALRAIDQIIAEMHQEGVSDSDPQMQEARERLLPRYLTQFHSAVRETFTTLFYPTRDRLMKVDFLMEFKDNHYDGEEQVRATLAGKQKYTEDIASDTFRRKVEAKLFTQTSMLWSEIKRKAATDPTWQWHREGALEHLKQTSVHQDVWREEGNYVNKGPFPKASTSVRWRELSRDEDTGVVKLRLTPVNADRLYAEIGAPATPASSTVEGGIYEGDELLVSFLAVDSKKEHETGPPVEWRNRITLKSREYADGNERMIEIRSAPPAPIRYSTDGSDPNVNGGTYEGPFALPEGTRFVLAVAQKNGITSEQLKREIADKPQPKPINPSEPVVWKPGPSGCAFETTQSAYGFITRLKKHNRRCRRPHRSRAGRRDMERTLPVGKPRDGCRAPRSHHRDTERTRAGRRSGNQNKAHTLQDRAGLHRLRVRHQGRVQPRRREALKMTEKTKSHSKKMGFGFQPEDSEHHFVVMIPAGNRDDVFISEHVRFDPEAGHAAPSLGLGPKDAKLRVKLARTKWNAIADEIRVEFNRRLKREALPVGRWKTGINPVARLLGKELTLLAWAVEDADPTLIPAAIRNWLGLAPEERWWMFTMTNAATGHAIHGRGKGWRKAVRFALTENPVTGMQLEPPSEIFNLSARKDATEETQRPRKKPRATRKSPTTRRTTPTRNGAATV